jgi:dGTPase
MIHAPMLNGIAIWEILAQTFSYQGGDLQDLERHRMIRHLVGLMVTDMVQATDGRLKDSGAETALELQQLGYNVIGYSEDMHRRHRELKDFLYKKLYRHHRVVRMQVKAEHIVTELFEAFQAESAMLPDHVQQWIPARGLERTICDYIAGMTDRFAIEEHQRLHDPFLRP